jgi:hypothetical protein
MRIEPACRGFNYAINILATRSLQSAFPNGQDAPLRTSQLCEYATVYETIAKNLGPPESDVGRGPLEQNAPMSMPKASMNEDYGSKLWKNQIRFARQT